MNQFKLEELPLIEFNKLPAATNNSQEANKLGQGGFGPVYKVIMLAGSSKAILDTGCVE